MGFVWAACNSVKMFAAWVKKKDGNRPGRERTADRGKPGDPTGDIVRYLRDGEEADEPLVCGS